MDTSPPQVDISKLILEHWSALEAIEKRRITMKELAEKIGMNDKYLNHIYNKRRKPNKGVTALLASAFDDPRFYDAAGLIRPDPLLQYVQFNWGKVPDAVKKKIRDAMAPYVNDEDDD